MTDTRNRLTWVDTRGPHLVLPERSSAAWDSWFTPTGGRVVEASSRCNPDGPATDYDRACDVSGWLGVIPVGDGEALVLSGDDTLAAYYRWRRQHFILRWHYAPAETELLDHFHDVWGQLEIEEEATFQHPGGKVFLMAAADLPGRWSMQHAEFDLPGGRYDVRTTHTETEDIYLIVHHLRHERGAAGS